MDGRRRSVYCSVMPEAEPWSYHVDGSPVCSLADIVAEAVRRHPWGDRVHRGGPADLVRRTRPAVIGASGPEFAEVMYGAAKCRAIFTAVNKLRKQAIRASLSSVAVQ